MRHVIISRLVISEFKFNDKDCFNEVARQIIADVQQHRTDSCADGMTQQELDELNERFERQIADDRQVSRET